MAAGFDMIGSFIVESFESDVFCKAASIKAHSLISRFCIPGLAPPGGNIFVHEPFTHLTAFFHFPNGKEPKLTARAKPDGPTALCGHCCDAEAHF